MLTLKNIIENRDLVIKGLQKKHFNNAEQIIDEIIGIDNERRNTQKELDANLAEQNKIAKQIGALMAQGKKDEAEQAKIRTAQYKEQGRQLNERLNEIENSLKDKLLQVPNIPNIRVPEGRTAEDNVVERQGGEVPSLSSDAMPHWDLAKRYDLIDFELGVKITGAGFPVYKGKGARLQRALINFFLDEARNAGYLEVEPPYLVNADSGYGTGQLPDKEGQMYHAVADDLYLLPTAEVPVTNIYRDVILQEKDLPHKITA